MSKTFIVLLFLLTPVVAGLTAEKTLKFDSPEQEQRYYRLLENLRCMKCANQSLADSQAGLALDLRNKVYSQVRQGKTATQIRAYLVKRYGDYVLYKPRFRAGTLALWFAPLLILLAAVIVYRRVVQRQQHESRELTADDEKRIDALLNESGDNDRNRKT